MYQFKFINKEKNIKHVFCFFSIEDAHFVDIRTYFTNDPSTYSAWIHDIIDGQIIWKKDEGFLSLSPEAKKYIGKIASLRAFI